MYTYSKMAKMFGNTIPPNAVETAEKDSKINFNFPSKQCPMIVVPLMIKRDTPKPVKVYKYTLIILKIAI